MRKPHLFLTFLVLLVTLALQFQAHAAPAGPLIKHLSSLIRWTRASSKTTQSDGSFLQFEDGYLVETVVEGNELGVLPYSIRLSQDGELFAVDAISSNIVRITPPLSQYSRARLVAGSFQGHMGHVDGKPSDARFNHPKGVTMDDKGNVYVADTSNLAIRKIGEGGVTTIAGGKSNIVGYRDGPSEHAMFSSDFDVVYVRPTCSLLVVDRGNAALRQISLNEEDCDYQYNSISATDVILVICAVLVGYAFCMLQQGFGPSLFPKMRQPMESKFQEQLGKEKPTPMVETIKQEPDAAWPSFGQLVLDLSKLALEALGSVAFYLVPFHSKPKGLKDGLTPIQDTLKMPEDEAEPPLIQKQRTPAPLSETREEAHTAPNACDHQYSEMNAPQMKSSKDPTLPMPSKHRSLRRQEFGEFYSRGEVPPYGQQRTKTQKERSRHRQRLKSGEVVFGAAGLEPKSVEVKPVDYEDPNPKFDHYNMRSRYRPDESFRF